MIGILRLLKHLYFGEHLLGSIHLESLQVFNILWAPSLLTQFPGLSVSAIQSIAVLLDVVRIHI